MVDKNQPKEIFISYSRKGESNLVANEIDKAFSDMGINILRDKRSIPYKADIDKFMQRLGYGKYVIVVISDAYLTSRNCMKELVLLSANPDFYDRIFPVVMPDAALFDEDNRFDYTLYWNRKLIAFNKKVGNSVQEGIIIGDVIKNSLEYLNLLSSIRAKIDQLTGILSKMNMFSLQEFREKQYENLIKFIQDQIDKDHASESPDIQINEEQYLSEPGSFKEPKYFNRPPFYNPNELIGRNEKLKLIHETMKNARELVIVNGIGGIGKTTLARAYCSTPEYMSYYDNVAWISISNNLESEFVSKMSKDIGFKYNEEDNYDENFVELMRKFQEIRGTNLLVVDNANNPDEIIKIKSDLEKSNWKILFTSRCKPMYVKHIEINELEPDFAKELFCRIYFTDLEYCLDKKMDKEICALLVTIHHHTLLIDLIAKVANRNKLLTISKINELLKKDDIKAKDLQVTIPIGEHARDKDTAKLNELYRYIKMIFKVDNLNTSEREFLRAFSLLPSNDININSLVDLFQIKEEGSLEFVNMLNSLVVKGWLTETGSAYKLHHVYQTVLLDELRPDEINCEALVNFVLEKIAAKKNESSAVLIPYLPVADSIINKIAKENEISANFYFRLSNLFNFSSNQIMAFDYALKCLEIRKKIFPEENAELAKSFDQVGNRYSSKQQFENALENKLKSLGIRERLYLPQNPKHKELAASYNSLGNTYRRVQMYQLSLEFHEKAIQIFKDVDNGVNFSLGKSYNNIALTYQSLGEYQKELDYYFKALAVYEKILDPTHGSFGVTFSNIASAYRNLKMLDKAEEYYNKALTLRKIIFNENHNKIAVCYIGLAYLHSDYKNYEKALEYAMMTMDIRKPLFDETTREMANVYSCLGIIYRQMEDYNNAQLNLEKAFEIRKLLFGENNVDTAISYQNLAQLFFDLKEYEKAKEHVLKAISIRKSLVAANHPKLLESNDLLEKTEKAMA